jgi:AmiR/NasT family two-component response regulator
MDDDPDRAGSVREMLEAGGVEVVAVLGSDLEALPRVEALAPDLLIAPFARFQELRAELDKAKASLAERKLVERAKGILMKSRGCGEDEAYTAMRKMAMDQKLRLAEVANKIIAAADLLG